MLLKGRRALLAGGLAATATVAGLWWLRKPLANLAMPAGATNTTLSDLGRVQAISPPRTPPDVTLTDAAGRAVGLDAWKGKALVLNFWATWCGPCVKEMPALQALAKASPELTVVPVSADAGGAPVVRKFYTEHDITTLPIWLDPEGKAGDQFGIPGLPTTFLIGVDGKVRGVVVGGADWMALRKQVLALLRPAGQAG